MRFGSLLKCCFCISANENREQQSSIDAQVSLQIDPVPLYYMIVQHCYFLKEESLFLKAVFHVRV